MYIVEGIILKSLKEVVVSEAGECAAYTNMSSLGGGGGGGGGVYQV